jgi:hypothetical protein
LVSASFADIRAPVEHGGRDVATAAFVRNDHQRRLLPAEITRRNSSMKVAKAALAVTKSRTQKK